MPESGSGAEWVAQLAKVVGRHVRSTDDLATSIPGLSLHRRHEPTAPLHCIYSLGLSVVAQGGKQVMLRDEVVDYRPGYCMLTTIDHAVVSHVTQASPARPFLAAMLCFDVREILQMAAEMQLPPLPKESEYKAVSIEPVEPALADAFLRLVEVLDEPQIAPHLAPLIRQEIIIRLLSGNHSRQLLHLVSAGSPTQQVSRAIAWLKQNFVQLLRMDDLAERVHMSPSSFRHHFRTITGMSPLQFQKQLRLQEARQLMLNQNLDASHAAGLVGYESASQFSREYSRTFGAPPQRDVRRMRQAG
jgi:AraC-like DNA-binding protein